MIISLNWLKQFTSIDLPVEELVELIGSRLVEVESVTDLGKKYQGIIVAKVVEAKPLEGTDHLSLTKIDDGGVTKDVERDDKGLVQVVCGAPNVREGLFVPWITPGSTVPSTYDSTEPLVLVKKEIKGKTSNGMLASSKELDLSDDHSGIMELPEGVPGKTFSFAYSLDDYLLNIENKSLTHRPDCFGVIGFAREVAAIQGKEFVTPDWLAEEEPSFSGSDEKKIKVSIDDPELSERYQAVILSGENKAKEEFPLTPTLLSRSGVRSISPVVDVTNYMMLETGQPLHAFDYDKLLAVGGGKIDIHVRAGRKGEKLELLDGREIELDLADIVIANGETAVALAGAMGGASTEIDANTKNILLESASFNLFRLRSTQMRHGMFSEAVTRFTKGQPAELTAPVLAQAIELICAWTGAKQVSAVAEATGNKVDSPTIELTVNEVNGVLGTAMSQTEIETILRNVEFAAVESGHNILTVSPPYWRRDIHVREDLIEEIGRISGFDLINPTLPLRDFKPVTVSEFDKFRTNIRKILSRAGANEVLTYSFIHGDVIIKAGQKVEDSYKLTNSLSPDLQYYRQSLTPSLLGLVHSNAKQGFEEFAIYELNKVHTKSLGLDEEKVPVERDAVALVVSRKKAGEGAAYYQARALVEYLVDSLGLKVSYKTIDEENDSSYSAFEPKRSAYVVGGDGQKLGIVGEYKSSVAKGFKLSEYTAGFELDTRALMSAYEKVGNFYKPSSKYPGTDRDICFQTSQKTKYEDVIGPILNSLQEAGAVDYKVTPVDIYVDKDSSEKNITVRISLVSPDKTLTSEEANNIIAAVSDAVVKATGAKVI